MEERHLSDFLYSSTDELKSYSDSFESRARDRFVAYVKELYELGSSDEYRTMFHSDKIVIGKRNRRLLDYIEVTANYDQANSRVTVPLPPLTMNQMLELSNAIIAKEKQIEKNMFAVKAQTGQQIRKGLENEYIDQIDAAKVSREIDQIVAHYTHNAKMFSIAKREMVMGSFKPKTPEEEEMYPTIGPARDVLLGKTMEPKPLPAEEPDDEPMVE